MLVYHGSNVIVAVPRIIPSSRPMDFGSGFYVTTNPIQANSWAVRVALRSNLPNGYVNAYTFDEENANRALRILRFPYVNESWLLFICANRSGKQPAFHVPGVVPETVSGTYDIVIGPVADDAVYRVVVNFENGDFDKETALKKLKAEKLSDQILFHTPESLQYLHYTHSEVSHHE